LKRKLRKPLRNSRISFLNIVGFNIKLAGPLGLQVFFAPKRLSQKLFFTPKPLKGGLVNICKSISPPWGDLGVSNQEGAFETASLIIMIEVPFRGFRGFLKKKGCQKLTAFYFSSMVN
jgi:hypothetical protein